MNKILIATIAAVAMSGAASAADMSMPVKARPAPAPVYSWTGCYLGAGGGYGMYNAEGTQLTVAGGFNNAEGTSGGRGYLGQVQGGCDYQFTLGNLGNFVIGAFGDGDWGSIKGNHIGLANGFVGTLKDKSAVSAGGRFGYLVSPTFLAYESAGWTSSRFDQVNYSSVATGAASGISLAAQRYNGWFWGSGFEYAFTWLPIQGLFLKTEYRFSQFQSRNVGQFNNATGALVGLENLKPYTQSVTTELVYRFNWH